MRPLRLSLQAFQSYPGEFEIDFVRLGQHGVFSITGPTGSGKTTIFDAMVYALYGELPGKREADDVRSDFAKGNVETVVTFEFEVKGVAWTIERRPAQMRPKTRGKGETKQLSSVLLRQSHETAGGLTKQTEVANEIRGIIGLTAEQFQQVVLLPQGEFEAVLKAETKERVELLRRLFPVEIFGEFTEFLKGEMDNRRVVLDEVKQSANAATDRVRRAFLIALSAIPVGVAHSWYESLFDEATFDLSQFQGYRVQLSTTIDEVSSRCEAARLAYERVSEALGRIETVINAYDRWIRNREQAKSFPEAEEVDRLLERELDELQKLAGVISVLDTHDEAAKDLHRLEITQGRQRMSLERNWIASYDAESLADAKELSTVVKRVARDRDLLVNALDQRDELVGDLEELTAQQEILQETAEQLAELEENEKIDNNRLETLDSFIKKSKPIIKNAVKIAVRLEQARKRQGEIESRVKVEASIAGLRKEHTSAHRALTKAEEAFSKLQLAYRAGLAGQLADALVPGEPCPTCGSKDHPAPAKAKRSAPTADALDEAELEVSLARKEESRLARAISKLEGQLESVPPVVTLAETKAEVKRLGTESKTITETGEAMDDAEVEIVEIKATISERKRMLIELRAGAASVSTTVKLLRSTSATKRRIFEKKFGPLVEFDFDENEFNTFLERLEIYLELIVKIGNVESSLSQSNRTLAPYLERHGLESVEALRRLMKPESEILEARTSLTDRRSYRAQVSKEIVEYEATEHPDDRPDDSTLRREAEIAKTAYEDRFSALTTLRNQGDIADEGVTSFKAFEGEITRARMNFEEAATFYRLCAGQSAGSNQVKVALEEWVLSVYLKRVLRQANARIGKMSSGRYSLQVNSLGGDGRGRHGLDLEVFDTYTGKARKARTLSGGETFKSALALALGLADVVSAGKNRDLGALFIDEGFGSLDEQSLEQVLDVLDSLQDGGRVVGVISHVEELKLALPSGIKVEGTDEGSKASIQYPSA